MSVGEEWNVNIGGAIAAVVLLFFLHPVILTTNCIPPEQLWIRHFPRPFPPRSSGKGSATPDYPSSTCCLHMARATLQSGGGWPFMIVPLVAIGSERF